MSVIRTLVLVLSLWMSTQAFAADGAGGSNGGAGLIRGGRLMSFYSAGLYVEPNPLGVDNGLSNPPGLDELIHFVENFPYWGTPFKASFLKAAMPTSGHQYFKVKEDQFDEATLKRILAEYSRVTQIPIQDLNPEEPNGDGVRIFAITDIEQQITYLLPEFFKLDKRSDQVAILFHENLWILSREGTQYKQIVDDEMAFQAVYEQPNNGSRILKLLESMGTVAKLPEVIGKIDLDMGNLTDLLTPDQKLPLATLLGTKYLSCKSDECDPKEVEFNLLRLVQAHPRSVLLRHILDKFQHSGELKVKSTAKSWEFSNFFLHGGSILVESTSEENVAGEERRWDLEWVDFTRCNLSLKPGEVGKLYCSSIPGKSNVEKDSVFLEL